MGRDKIGGKMDYIVCFYKIIAIGVEVIAESETEAIEKAKKIWRKDHAIPIVKTVEEVIT